MGAPDAADVLVDCEHDQVHWSPQERVSQQHQHVSEAQSSISTFQSSCISHVIADTKLVGSTRLPWPDTDMALDSQQQLLSDVLKISMSDAQLLLFSNQEMKYLDTAATVGELGHVGDSCCQCRSICCSGPAYSCPTSCISHRQL